MIAGTGIDIVDLNDFTHQLQDGASTFVEGTFTAREIAYASSFGTSRRARHLAARFAAKEAFIKAWSGGRWGRTPVMSPESVDMREIEVARDGFGRPSLRLTGDLEEAFSASFPLGSVPKLHLSLSHDGGYAVAMLIVEI